MPDEKKGQAEPDNTKRHLLRNSLAGGLMLGSHAFINNGFAASPHGTNGGFTREDAITVPSQQVKYRTQ